MVAVSHLEPTLKEPGTFGGLSKLSSYTNQNENPLTVFHYLSN